MDFFINVSACPPCCSNSFLYLGNSFSQLYIEPYKCLFKPLILYYFKIKFIGMVSKYDMSVVEYLDNIAIYEGDKINYYHTT